MKPRLWQAIVFAAIVFGIVHIALSHVDRFALGRPGFVYTPVYDAPRIIYRVDVVQPDGPAAGTLRPGDQIEFPGNNFEGRVLFGGYPAGARVPVVVVRGGVSHDVVLRMGPAKANSPLAITFTVLFLAFFAVGGLIALQRPDDPRARALAAFLVTFPLAVFDLTASTSAEFTAVHDLAVSLLLGNACYQLLLFATIFPEPSTQGFRAVLRRVNLPAALILVFAYATTVVFGDWVGRMTPQWLAETPSVAFVVYFVLITASLLGALREARGIDRQRALWMGLSIGVGFSGIIVDQAIQLFGEHPDWLSYAQLTMVAFPVGMAYVLLRHRLLDVGFVLNRALVFAAVSAVVVALFGTLEFLVNRYLVDYGHVSSSVVELGVALAIGLLLRPIHERMDRIIDDVFFRQRHRAEHAVRRFAHELAFITDTKVALARTVETLARQMKAGSVAILLADPAATYVPVAELVQDTLPVDENDAALVRMRAFGTWIDLHDVETRLVGTHAFPLIVRGAMIGALACGRPAGVEAFAPDEVDAIDTLAHALATTIDVLRTAALEREVAQILEGRGSHDSLRAALASKSAGQLMALE